MDIKTFASLIRKNKLALFTSHDLTLLTHSSRHKVLPVQLHQWVRKGWISRLKRGLYELTYPEPLAIPDLHIANRLYSPSYVSMETALSHYQIIPEFAVQVTSATSKSTRRFVNPHGLFTYFTVTPRAFCGYRMQKVGGFEIKIAEPEKAIADRLYAALRRGENPLLLCSRWDRQWLKKNANRAKLLKYFSLFSGYREKLEGYLDAFLR